MEPGTSVQLTVPSASIGPPVIVTATLTIHESGARKRPVSLARTCSITTLDFPPVERLRA